MKKTAFKKLEENTAKTESAAPLKTAELLTREERIAQAKNEIDFICQKYKVKLKVIQGLQIVEQ